MANIDETKAQLLRGAVQDNIDVLQGVRSRPASTPRRRLGPWMLWSLLLVAGIAYLTLPAQVTWRGGAANSAPMAQDALSAVG